MPYQWSFRSYQRRFKQALQTSHGSWTVRAGIILRLTDAAGRVGWGEIAPIPWFGSETFEQALAFCHRLPNILTDDLIFAVPDTLPSCQFAFESAWECMHPLPSPLSPLPSLSYSALLPAGDVALHTWQPLWEQGFRTFKWKIGVQAIATELKLLDALTQALPKPAKLRLDANGALSTDEAAQWLQACDAMPSNQAVALEYIEQPLPIAQFEAMQDLNQRYRTAIALDESVATLQQLQACYENGWRGIFVIKPAIVGSPTRLRQFCQHHPIDAVFSSAFETAIGRQAGLRLAASLGNPDRAVGYGTTHWFEDSDRDDFEQLWQTL